jgi:hypothetical protein
VTQKYITSHATHSLSHRLSTLTELSLVPGHVQGELPPSLSECYNLRFLTVNKKLISNATHVDGVGEGQAHPSRGGGGTVQDLVPKEARGKLIVTIEELTLVRKLLYI